MKRLKSLALATTSLALAACGDNPEVPTTDLEAAKPSASSNLTTDLGEFDDLLNKPFSIDGASEADLSDLVAALPAYASIEWETKSFDANSGATVFKDLSIGFGEAEKFGLNFEEAKVWGLETDLLEARLQGERLSESGAIYTRLDGKNMSYFGAAEAMNRTFALFLDQIEEDFPPEFTLSVDEFESVTERVVSTNASLLPWELVLAPAELLSDIDEDAQSTLLDVMHLGQHLIAVTRSIGYDDMVLSKTKGRFAMTQPGAVSEVDMAFEFAAYRGARGFDLASAIVRGGSTSQTNTYQDVDFGGDEFENVAFSPFPDGFTMAQEANYASSRIADIRLDKLMGFLARAELPDMEERDLLSLGQAEILDYTVKLDEGEILSAERFFVDMTNFEWFIPSQLEFTIEGATLRPGEFSGIFLDIFEAGMRSTAIDEPEMQQEFDLVMEGIGKAIDLLPQHGLDQIPFDTTFKGNWDADAGPTDTMISFDSDGFGAQLFEIDLNLPTYEMAKTIYNSDDPEAAFETAFEETFAFNSLRWKETDKGGFDKLFGFAHALGKEYPDQGWGAVLGSMEPAQMRAYLGTTMRFAKAEATREFPQAADWIEAYARYLESGGSFEFVAAPPQPITMELIESYDDRDPEPEEMVEIFGLKVTHTK